MAKIIKVKKNNDHFCQTCKSNCHLIYEIILVGYFKVILREDLFYQSPSVPLKTVLWRQGHQPPPYARPLAVEAFHH